MQTAQALLTLLGPINPLGLSQASPGTLLAMPVPATSPSTRTSPLLDRVSGAYMGQGSRVLRSPGWPRTHYVSQTVLKLTVLILPLPLPSECWEGEGAHHAWPVGTAWPALHSPVVTSSQR